MRFQLVIKIREKNGIKILLLLIINFLSKWLLTLRNDEDPKIKKKKKF